MVISPRNMLTQQCEKNVGLTMQTLSFVTMKHLDSYNYAEDAGLTV
jgi:hypothetical protein